MGKYAPLRDYLTNQGREYVPMSFRDIEAVIGEQLPASKQYPAWWSNNPSNNVMTKEWLAAGYETEQVDIGGQKLVFRKVRNRVSGAAASSGAGGRGNGSSQGSRNNTGRLETLFANMRGLLTLAPGYDPTKPVEDSWPEPYLGEEKNR